MTDRPYNAANRKDVRIAEKAVLDAATIDRDVIKGLMSVPNGRFWMFEMLGFVLAYADPFTPDPYSHAYNAGKKAIGTKLHNDIMLYAPTMYDVMIREAYERSITDAQRRDNARADASADGDDLYLADDAAA